MTSTIKVNTVKDTASTDIIKKCGTSITVGTASDTTTVAGNAVRSNAIQASDGQNIISQVGTTITLGATGDNIVLAGGATQSGFGRTGTVDWITTPKTTGTFTAASGEGYFLNTSGGVITANLPAGVAGAIVSLADYAATWQTNNVTVTPNGTDKIGSVNQNVTLNTEGQSVTLVFVDSTQGWINTMDSTSNVRGNAGICASVSGACNTLVTAPCCANVKIATFTGPGTFTVNNISSTAAENTIGYMVVAGGGAANSGAGGGGAGGYREGRNTSVDNFTSSPLVANAPTNAVTITAQAYPITVGAGGGASPAYATPGANSVFDTITATGGGGGRVNPGGSPGIGGSGGGGSRDENSGGAGNTPPVSPPQGNNGGTGVFGPPNYGSGGGGGASAAGSGGGTSSAGAGGNGVTNSINASSVTRAGGGGGGTYSTPGGGAGGSGGGGSQGNNGGVNTGGGAGGGVSPNFGTTTNGGSGIVIVRYKFQ